MINDSQSALEDLLVNLVRWAKSFTVDMLGLDIIYICDLKPENLLRLIDVEYYVNKLIEMHEKLDFSHSDTIHKMISEYLLKTGFKFEDFVNYIKWLCIGDSSNNHLFTKDESEMILKTILAEEKEHKFDLYDVASWLVTRFDFKDKCGLKDGIYQLWYSDP